MRLVRFGGAMSLDGYIAGPEGEYDWIQMDPEMDFAEMMAPFDTFLIGRKTFEKMLETGMDKPPAGIDYFVISRTMQPGDAPHATVRADPDTVVKELRMKAGKEIAIFGGGVLFRSLLEAGLVDRVEVSVVPVLLGGGVPLLPPPAQRTRLKLLSQRLYAETGTLRLEYEVIQRKAARDPG